MSPAEPYKVAALSFHKVVMKISVIEQDLDNVVISTGETLIILILEGCLNSVHQEGCKWDRRKKVAYLFIN